MKRNIFNKVKGFTEFTWQIIVLLFFSLIISFFELEAINGIGIGFIACILAYIIGAILKLIVDYYSDEESL